MRIFETKIIQPLIYATHDRYEICKKFPKEENYHFKVNDLEMRVEWKKFYDSIKDKILTVSETVGFSDQEAYKLAYFLLLFAKIFKYFGTSEHDAEYINAVDYFFIVYKTAIGAPEQEEVLFKNAFVS